MKEKEITGKGWLALIIALMVGAFLIQIPAYLNAPGSDVDHIHFPGIGEMIIGSFFGGLILVIVYQVLRYIQKETTGSW